MARKNTQRADSTEVFLFDSRTKAVMAQSTQDGIKEKLAAVREVVPGKSNTEICLVLQYYDYDVEQTIHSYLEDGAKDALQDWHYPSTKQPKKKKKKNKSHQQGGANKDQGPTSQQGTSETGSGDAQGTSQASLDPSLVDSIASPAGTSNNEAASTNAVSGDINCNSYSHDEENHIPPECHSVPGTEYEDPTEVPPLINASGSSTEAPSPSKGRSVPTSDEEGHTVPVSSLPVSVSVTVSASKLDSNSVSSLPATQPRHHQPVLAHQSRPRNLDGRAREHGSSPVITPDTKSRRPHAGLEKSIKDLQRQNTSLQRLRTVLGEEIDRSYKKIKHVFEELHRELSEREAEVLFDMDKVKSEAVETLIRRQDKAFELKQRTDRAQTMNEHEVAELRADIKQFVSDRKIDEDLSRTTRFSYETNHLIENIRKFGDIAPVKNNYTQRRPSVSSISSSVVSHEDIQSPSTPITPLTPGTPLSASASSYNFPAMQTTSAAVSGATSKLPVTSMTVKSDTMSAKELAELQQRLNTSMMKQGLPTKSASPKRGSSGGARPRSATSSPAKTNATNTDSEQSTDDAKKSRNARRRQRLRERQREARRANQNESGQESESLSPAQPQRNSNSNMSKPAQMTQGRGRPPKQRTPSPDKPRPGGDQAPRKDSRGRGQSQRSNQGQGFKPQEQGQRPNRGPRQGSSPSKTNKDNPKPVLKGREGSEEVPSSRPQEKGDHSSPSPKHKPYVAKDNKPHRVEVSINSAQHSVPIDNRAANGSRPVNGNHGNTMLNGGPEYTPSQDQALPQRKPRNKVDKRRNVRLDQNGVVNGEVHDIHSEVVNGGTQ